MVLRPLPKNGWSGSGFSSETGRIRFRRVRFQTLNSVSLLGLTEFRGEKSVSSSQPMICVPKWTHRVFRGTHRVCRRTQWVLSSETILSKQYSARFLFRFGWLKGFLRLATQFLALLVLVFWISLFFFSCLFLFFLEGFPIFHGFCAFGKVKKTFFFVDSAKTWCIARKRLFISCRQAVYKSYSAEVYKLRSIHST